LASSLVDTFGCQIEIQETSPNIPGKTYQKLCASDWEDAAQNSLLTVKERRRHHACKKKSFAQGYQIYL
jgi:hypothetical protein